MGALFTKRRRHSSRSTSTCSRRRLISTGSDASSYHSCVSSVSSSSEQYEESSDELYATIDDVDVVTREPDTPLRSNDIDIVVPLEEDDDEKDGDMQEHFYHEIGAVPYRPNTASSPPALPTRTNVFFNGYANVTADDYMRPAHCEVCHDSRKDFVPVYQNGLREVPWKSCILKDIEPVFVIEKPRDNDVVCASCGLHRDQCFGDRWCVNLCFHLYENTVFHVFQLVS